MHWLLAAETATTHPMQPAVPEAWICLSKNGRSTVDNMLADGAVHSEMNDLPYLACHRETR